MRDYQEFVPGEPDWVIAGWSTGDGSVTVVASRHLADSRISVETVDEIPLSNMTPGWMMTGAFVRLVSLMDRWTVVPAGSYPEAFVHLFERWAPWAPDSGVAAIEAGPGMIDAAVVDD